MTARSYSHWSHRIEARPRRRRVRLGRRPLQQLVGGPGVDDPFGRHTRVERALSAVAEKLQLAGRMRVSVDGKQEADLQRQVQQARGWVPALGPRVDLDGGAVVAAGGEHLLGIELRFGPD